MQAIVPGGTQPAREPQPREARPKDAPPARPAPGPWPRRSQEPIPWFMLVICAILALGVVATSAARILRFHIEDTAREQRWRLQHDAMLREVAEYENLP